MAADITPYIKQLKKRPVLTIVVLKKGNWKLTHESSYKIKDSFRDMEIEGRAKKVEREVGDGRAFPFMLLMGFPGVLHL